jgi:hypothetical protein
MRGWIRTSRDPRLAKQAAPIPKGIRRCTRRSFATSRISEIRFHPARPDERRRGTYGWASAAIDGSHIDGLTVRRAEGGELRVVFPDAPMARPLSKTARAALAAQVIAYLRERGFVT